MAIRGIFCLNSRCEHYFEDNCMKILQEDTVRISEEGNCEDFKQGINIGYADKSALSNAAQEVLESAT